MSTSQQTQTTFAKLRSGWGIKGDADLIAAAIESDSTLTVAKKAGDTKQVRPHSIVWSKDGVALATIVDDRPARKRSQRSRPECSECGEFGPTGQLCNNCFEGHFA